MPHTSCGKVNHYSIETLLWHRRILNKAAFHLPLPKGGAGCALEHNGRAKRAVLLSKSSLATNRKSSLRDLLKSSSPEIAASAKINSNVADSPSDQLSKVSRLYSQLQKMHVVRAQQGAYRRQG
eukprot:6174892-Pleurochrysis_carterae.AAC.1